MFRLHLTYIIFNALLFAFGLAFFAADAYLPYLRNWKSKKLHQQSMVYLDNTIDDSSGLLKDGVRKARIAHLLAPNDPSTLDNYLLLLFRTKPAQALIRWSQILSPNQSSIEERAILLDRAKRTLQRDEIDSNTRSIAGKIAFQQAELLKNDADWFENPENILTIAELLTETGNAKEGLKFVNQLLAEYPLHPEGTFLLTRISVHLKDTSNLSLIGRSLATLSSQRNQTGKEAIRHMTLLHLLSPLSPESLARCLELLEANPHTQQIDFLRICALQHASSKDKEMRSDIISYCSELFDLNDNSEVIIFNRWLARLGDYEKVLEYLPASKAKVDEELFKLRMNALAQVNDLERIHEEINNAPIIPSRWRLVVEARAHAMNGNFKDAAKSLDRLLPILGDDPRQVRSVCHYLESANDLKNLSHILVQLIDKPIHSQFALRKLLQHRSASASLSELILWLSQLSKSDRTNKSFEISLLYLRLLDPSLPSPSKELTGLVAEAQKEFLSSNSNQIQITLALAHLRNQSPDQALVALGEPNNWRKWLNSRTAWAFIASQIYRLNHESEKALALKQNLEFSQMDKAELTSLSQLFPEDFSTPIAPSE
ncbi:MAG: hypothetical protein VYA10_11405 [Verrucomicrobiota bacterium]|nr:hypothetical protein [Verrucomicrobiota bacterium]